MVQYHRHLDTQKAERTPLIATEKKKESCIGSRLEPWSKFAKHIQKAYIEQKQRRGRAYYLHCYTCKTNSFIPIDPLVFMPIYSFASRGGYCLEESLGSEPVILSYQYITLEQTNNHKLAQIITYYLPLNMLLKGYYRKVMLNYFLSFF